MKILIGTGLHYPPGGETAARDFFDIWLANKRRFVPADRLSRIVVLADSGCYMTCHDTDVLQLALAGDVGHFFDTLRGIKKHHFNGWMASVLALAMIAYNDESDFVYAEADCLAFGPWLELMCEQIDQASVIFGSYLRPDGTHIMACAQSLFMVKHAYLPTFCRLILEGPPQNTDSQLGENVFARLEREHSWDWKRFTFGVDRGRPLPLDADVWYAQKLTAEELESIRTKGLL